MARLGRLAAILVLPLLALSAPSPSSPFAQFCNATHHFDCHDATKPCIPLEWICDHVKDCPNGQDEHDCAYLHDCPRGQLMCRSGECVDSSYRCDGQVDCDDSSDEKGCGEMELIVAGMASARPTQPSVFSFSAPTSAPRRSFLPSECGRGEYQCRSGSCIDNEAKCDGVWDCPNGDDETECPTRAPSPSLSSSGGSGRPMSAIMEAHCSTMHGESHRCADESSCIPASWVCDREPDCDDGSDEAHCEYTKEEEMQALIDERMREREEEHHPVPSGLPSAHEFLSASDDILCAEDHFRCKGGRCLNASVACDGKKDCPLGDDETDRCRECASKRENSCSHGCIDLPTGHKCSCPRGMILGADGSSCEDYDECAHEGQRCSHHCENKHNGYECTCAEGYELGKDRHSCHLREKDMDGAIMVSLTGEIRSAPMFSPLHSSVSYETVLSTHNHGATKNLAMDIEGARMFATIEPKPREGVLASISGGVVTRLRENITGIAYVAHDWIGGNIVYAVRHPSPAPGIFLCKANGLHCRKIVKGRSEPKRQGYRGLAVNPLKGLVAWIDVDGTENRIMVANLDGSGVRAIVDHKLPYPSGLAFDVIKNEIYFGDIDTLLIEKVNLESGRRSTVAYPVHHPYEMAYFNNLIYWTEWGTTSLKVASVGMEHSSPHLIHSFLSFPYGIALNHTMTQPRPRSNPCEGVDCPWMCVVVAADDYARETKLEARCVCPDEYEQNDKYDDKTKGSMPCRMLTKREAEEADKPLSRVTVEALEGYCKSGEVCGNGGKCVHHENSHGRVDEITCKCVKGYGGLWCELPPLPKAEAMDGVEVEIEEGQDDDEESSVSIWTILIVVLALAMIGGLVYWGRRNGDEITSMGRSTLHRVQEARLPERASELIKNTRNMARGGSPPSAPSAPSSTSFSARNQTTTTSALSSAASLASSDVAPSAPSMYPPLPSRASSTSLASASSLNHFSNPLFDGPTTTGAPYSGFEEMNTTEPSFFSVDRPDGVEQYGNNPFGRMA